MAANNRHSQQNHSNAENFFAIKITNKERECMCGPEKYVTEVPSRDGEETIRTIPPRIERILDETLEDPLHRCG